MRHRVVLGPVLGLALVACQSSVARSPDPTGAATGTSTPTAPPSPTVFPTARATSSVPPISCADPASTPTLVAYADESDLWLYDAAVDQRRQLTDDGVARVEHDPAFVSGTCLVYASTQPTTIELLDLVGGGSRRLAVEEAGGLGSLAVSADEGTVLYMHIDYDVDSTFRLKQVPIGGGAPEVVNTFSPSLGRGGGSEDEVSVAWSPGGSAILVANTHEYSKEYPNGAIYLFEATGREMQRWAGTHPRWSPDGRTIYYRGHAGVDGQWWYALDVQTMKATKVGIRPATNWLVVSPDGNWVAYDTSWFGELPSGASFSNTAPEVFAYNLTTEKERLLESGALGALWISGSEVVVANARDRGPNSLNSWESLGTVTRVSIGAESSPVNMTSTLFDAAVLIGS